MIPPLGPGALVASRYEILSLLGTGGMGVVFKAHDRTLDDLVALKVLRTGADLDLIRRFRSEVKLARKVRHKNVCAIQEYGEDGERLYITMDFIEGTDLKRLLGDQGALFRPEAYDYALQVGEGLRAIHEAGVIHRDLKPANVMKDQAGVVRVMDFGIAKLGAGSAPDLTGEGKVVGSPEYMSPEQVRGDSGLDFRSDLYSLGILTYELFAGHVPFRAEDAFATMRKHLFEEPDFEDPDGTKFPPALVPVLVRALAKSPDKRYSSCAAMMDDLRAAREAFKEEGTDPVALAPSSGKTPTDIVPGLAVYPPQVRLLIPTLIRALKNPSSEVRLGAVAALRRTPDESVRPALAEAFVTEADGEVRRRIREVLDILGVAAAPGEAGSAEGSRPATPSVEPAPEPPPSDERPTDDLVAPVDPPPSIPPKQLASQPGVAPSGKATPPPPPVVLPPVPKVAPLPPDDSPRPVVPSPPVPERRPVAPPAPAPDFLPRPAPAPSRSLGMAVLLVAVILVAVIGVGLWSWRRSDRAATPGPSPDRSTSSPNTSPSLEPPREPQPSPSVSPSTSAGSTAAPPNSSPRPRPKPTMTPPGPLLPSTVGTTLRAVEQEIAGPEPSPTTTLPPPAPPMATPSPLADPLPIGPGATPSADERPPVPEPGVDPPVCVRCPPPDYPPLAVRFKRQGTVELQALIDESGRVAAVKVIRGVQWLTDAAVVSVRNRIYRPATRQGKPVKAWIEVPIRFDLPK